MPRESNRWEDDVASEMYDKGLFTDRSGTGHYTEEEFIRNAKDLGFYQYSNEELKDIYSRSDYYRSSFEYSDTYDKKMETLREEQENWLREEDERNLKYEKMLLEEEQLEEEERQERFERLKEEEQRQKEENAVYEAGFILEEMENHINGKNYVSALMQADNLDWRNLISLNSEVYKHCKESVTLCFERLRSEAFELLREGEMDELNNISVGIKACCKNDSWHVILSYNNFQSWENFFRLRLFLPKFLVMVQNDEKLASSLSGLSDEEMDYLITSRIEDMVLKNIIRGEYDSVKRYVQYLPSRKDLYDTAYRKKGDELFFERNYAKSYEWYSKLSESGYKKVADDKKFTIGVEFIKNKKPDLAIKCFHSFYPKHRVEILELCEKAKKEPFGIALGTFLGIHFTCLFPEVIYIGLKGPFTSSTIKDFIIMFVIRLLILFIFGIIAAKLDEKHDGKTHEKYYMRLAQKIEELQHQD